MSFTKHKCQIPPRANFTNPLFLLFPLLFSAEWPVLRVVPFTPRQLIYSKDFLPFLFAPWSWPACYSTVLSRLIQAALLSRLPNDFSSVRNYYALWTLAALARTLSGFLLTRSVGWAYPRLFAHFALYETTGGLGPALIAYLCLSGNRTFTDLFTSQNSPYTLETRGLFVIVALCGVLSWLDNAPWTYAMATICAAGLALLRAISSHSIRSRHHHPMILDPHSNIPQNQSSKLRTVLRTTLICLLLIPQPFFIGYIIHPTHKYLSMPPSPHAPSPLLEILVLSYPRPTDRLLYNATAPATLVVPSSILYTTLCSYLPFLSAERDSTTRLSVFTHTLPHHAFTHAKQYLSLDIEAQHTYVHVEFHADLDNHPEANSNQYLHLAEALRWVEGKAGGREDKLQAEWILLVEDDFALCGVWGWDGIVQVMQKLEAGRRRVENGTETLDRLGGFVATGGSGLIIHRTLLPILSFILRTHASIDSPLPRHSPPRPADLIIQDCLLGIDPLCPQPLSKSKFSSQSGTIHESGGGPLVITSRLIMDHIGARASTTLGRIYDSNKWRCGWRHPFHGREEVDVIAV